MKNPEVVTLAKYASLEEAQVINAMLESMGIDNEIMNDLAAQILPNLEGDVRIVVNSKDYDKAKTLLEAKIAKPSVVGER